MTKPIPAGFHSVTPTLTVRGAGDAIEFYKKAFNAEEINRFPGPDGKTIMHAEIKIGDSIIMLNDEFPLMNCLSPQSVGGPSSAIYLYVENSDSIFNRAVSAGAKVRMPMMNAFWGDRFGMLEDPYGHIWTVATRIIDLSPEEIKKAGTEASKSM
ncbi:MAG: VOC family protein [Thaumarchaeota archaeon]|nr:VOC family protein [Nitrososphaerota archaeon]